MKIYDVTDKDIALRDWKDALGKYPAKIKSEVQPSWIYMFGQFWYANDPPERKEIFTELLIEHEPAMAAWLMKNQTPEPNNP